MSTASEWRHLRARLDALIAEVAAEIRAYPPPIPACDAQFNHLLELRAILPGELARLDSAAQDRADIADFIAASPCPEVLARIVRGASKSPSPTVCEREDPARQGRGA